MRKVFFITLAIAIFFVILYARTLAQSGSFFEIDGDLFIVASSDEGFSIYEVNDQTGVATKKASAPASSMNAFAAASVGNELFQPGVLQNEAEQRVFSLNGRIPGVRQSPRIPYFFGVLGNVGNLVIGLTNRGELIRINPSSFQTSTVNVSFPDLIGFNSGVSAVKGNVFYFVGQNANSFGTLFEPVPTLYQVNVSQETFTQVTLSYDIVAMDIIRSDIFAIVSESGAFKFSQINPETGEKLDLITIDNSIGLFQGAGGFDNSGKFIAPVLVNGQARPAHFDEINQIISYGPNIILSPGKSPQAFQMRAFNVFSENKYYFPIIMR